MAKILSILVIILILLLLLFLYCACKVASIADEEMERLSHEDNDNIE